MARHVRDAAYWGLPVGTPIAAGMKPHMARSAAKFVQGASAPQVPMKATSARDVFKRAATPVRITPKVAPKAATKAPLTGQSALDATPAKLVRAPRGHYGDYNGEVLHGPSGMGSVRALSEYEGVEYQVTNNFLRGSFKEPVTGKPDTGHEPHLEGVLERVAEIDQTMAASKLTSDVKVHRVVKEGSKVWGRDVWYGDIIDWNEQDLDIQDQQMERWESGVRPDLTGLRWKEPAYSSTTADPAVVKEFGKGWLTANSPMDGEPVIMRILAPAGTGAVQLAEMGHAAEILLERGLTYEVVADHGVGPDGFRLLDVQVVPA